jgi:23S rRNA (cytidine1920-2'-O)/16S rRNA (cytidine1409-2'-O)-methyltransferase
LSTSKQRLDLLLVHLGKAKSRNQAQILIASGAVQINGESATKPSLEVSLSPLPDIQISESPITRFVSRGGLKLEGALKHTKLSATGLTVLDVGISTGGFTDCLLQNGAAKVVGVDVGHGQLDPRLENHPRLKYFEQLNARELTAARLAGEAPVGGFDLIVVDVSFISLELVLPNLTPLLTRNGHILALVKPQFEAGPKSLGKSGIVKDAKAFDEVKKKIYTLGDRLQLETEDYFESDIAGTDGNKEFFVLARHRTRS